jgi:ATP-dependent DNA helicase RecQ
MSSTTIDPSWDGRLLADLYKESRVGWEKLLAKLGLPSNIGIIKTMTLGQARAAAARLAGRKPDPASQTRAETTSAPGPHHATPSPATHERGGSSVLTADRGPHGAVPEEVVTAAKRAGPAPLALAPGHYRELLATFGLSEFKPLQREAVEAILEGRQPLVILPTGGGKSLCYQLPALALHHACRQFSVVISPLQALMEDQVLDLEAKGLHFATFINANLTAAERRKRMRRLREGSTGLLYISPEQLRSPGMLTLLRECPPALWVVDEAHAISQWGHDFRPDFRYVPKVIRQLADEARIHVPRLALFTATATAAVEADLQGAFERARLPLGPTLAGDVHRANLRFEVIPVGDTKDQVLAREVKQALQGHGCVIVYTTTRREAARLGDLFQNMDIPCRYFHGKMPGDQKREVLDLFKAGELRVVTATCAFGMGINRADVRAVIHHCMSPSLECYMQESGRAGRDDSPATCTLLFCPSDADTLFFLQGQCRLRQQDLRNIFLATRGLRDRHYHEASEDWFWATPEELIQDTPAEEDLSLDVEQREIKLRSALHHLEEFGMLARAENLSTSIRFDLEHQDPAVSQHAVEQSGRQRNFDASHLTCLIQLVQAMHRLKAALPDQEDQLPIEQLSDESGVAIRELIGHIRELQQMGVCTFQIPLTLVLVRAAAGDARRRHQILRDLEGQLLESLRTLGREGHWQVNLRGLASRLDPDRKRKIRAALLQELLDSWASQGWLALQRMTRDIVHFQDLCVEEPLARHRQVAGAVLDALYRALENQPRGRQRLTYDFNKLLEEVGEAVGGTSPEELQPVLGWLHDRKVVRVSEGLNLFQQAFKLKVLRGARVDTVGRRYPQVQALYDEQTRRTHLMLHYGGLPDGEARHRFVDHYFRLPRTELLRECQLQEGALSRPLIPGDYDRIVEDLNPAQRAIVTDDSAALAVVAGPGSGKTRTIVHRIAYLVKVQRVDPARILALAYNRNAMRQLRLRLRDLIGPLATRLRVFTFHGLALALLGRTLGQGNRSEERDFDRLLQDACELIEKGEHEEEMPDDVQTRRVQLLGNLEYIFVDEYQDVAENEYRLIRLIAGLDESEDDSRSVQINLCVIGDDDQNIYAFRGTSNKYLLQFADEYHARRLPLVENYRSTEPIIEAANRLIANNQTRLKQRPDEQVQIDSCRRGTGGLPVRAYRFDSVASQAAWVAKQVQDWVHREKVPPSSVAILAAQWDNLSPVRLLLERADLATSAINRGSVRLMQNRAACLLADELRSQAHHVWKPGESVEAWMRDTLINRGDRQAREPTVQALLKIGRDLDTERGLEDRDGGLPISADEVLTALYECNQAGEVYRDDSAVLVTSCHGAKGLEFDRVVLLTDKFGASGDEEKRRLFYVAMTRARHELVLCGTQMSQFTKETGVPIQVGEAPAVDLPQTMIYRDLTPEHVNLGHAETKKRQARIERLLEGEQLELKPNSYGDGWLVCTAEGLTIGALSRKCNQLLASDRLRPGAFQFQAGEVTARGIFRHLKLDEVTGKVVEDRFVVLPQLRICR